jgi:hypothetical protein
MDNTKGISNMIQPVYNFKINGLDSTTKPHQLAGSDWIAFHKAVKQFKNKAISIHLSQKNHSGARSIKDAKDLYNVDEYFAVRNDSNQYYDDSFDFWFTKKEGVK